MRKWVAAGKRVGRELLVACLGGLVNSIESLRAIVLLGHRPLLSLAYIDDDDPRSRGSKDWQGEGEQIAARQPDAVRGHKGGVNWRHALGQL